MCTAGTLAPETDAESAYQAYLITKTAESTFVDETNPLIIPFLVLLRFYQRFISRQEGDNCQFRPSCSHFSALAIKKAGLVRGLLMSGDRLLRCNPYTEGAYPVTADHHHYDKVEDYILPGVLTE